MPDHEQIIQSAFNNIVLPPKLPGRHDSDSGIIDKVLTERMGRAVEFLLDQSSSTINDVWIYLGLSLEICQDIHHGGFVNKKSLVEAFHRLRPGIAIILLIAEQNAGLLIYQDRCGRLWTTIFETDSIAVLTRPM